MSEEKEIISRPNDLKLIQLEMESYAGLNFEDKALVIHFPEHERITEFTGDQGVGKTSILNGLKALMGEKEPENSVNEKAQNKSATLTFEKGGDTYKVRLTKKSFSLTNVKEVEGKQVSSTINKPKDILSSLIGPIGVSPDFLSKKKSGEEQIEWIKSLSSTNTEMSALETRAKDGYKKAYESRTDVNRVLATIKQDLLATGYCVWDAENKVWNFTDGIKQDQAIIDAAPANDAEVRMSYDIAKKKADDLVIFKQRIEALHQQKESQENNIADYEAQITSIKLKIEMERQNIQKTNEAIGKGNDMIAEIQDAPTEFDKALSDLQNYGKIEIMRNRLDDTQSKLAQYHDVEATQLKINNEIVEWENTLRELAVEMTPNINGLEVEIGGIDSKKLIGVYFNGTRMDYLSESEQWDLCLQAWKWSGTSVVYIENSTSLGTAAIKRINWFAKNGGIIFMSTMSRGYKELSVRFLKEKE